MTLKKKAEAFKPGRLKREVYCTRSKARTPLNMRERNWKRAAKAQDGVQQIQEACAAWSGLHCEGVSA